jgi:hypothetical protein
MRDRVKAPMPARASLKSQDSLFPIPRTANPTSPSHPISRLRDQPLLPLPSASAVTGAASLSTAIQTEPSAARDEGDTLERRYVRSVLGRYLWLPGTPVLSSRHDRRLAHTLFERGVTLICVEAALLLGAARRALREPHLAPLPRVRSLSYFLPVLAEVLENPRPPDLEYLTCLLRRLRPLAELKAAQIAHERLYGHR